MELEHGSIANDNDENSTTNQHIASEDVDLNRHRIKDPNYLLERYPIGELSPDISSCRRVAKCVPLSRNTCMGTKLPYTFTTLDLIPERVTPDIVEVDKIIIYIFSVIFSCSSFL